LTQLLGHRDWDDFLYKFQCSTDGRDGFEGGASVAAAAIQDREPAIQDGELTFQEAFARHIIYPQRKVAIRSSTSSLYHTVTVTLLGSDDLNVNDVESSSLHFGGAPPMQMEMQDVR